MQSWGYTKENGPDTWVQYFFKGEMGERQSPINIVTSEAKYDSNLLEKPLTTTYTQEPKLQLKNSGHSIVCQIGNKSVVTGGPLTGTYQLEQFHLHWGSDGKKGSEHKIDGEQYDAELHLVHWNSSKYTSFSEAVSKDDGLAVLGIMINVGAENEAFKSVTDNLDKMDKADVTFDTTLNPTELLPSNTEQYWTYPGSLTTPPLFESVQWIVFKEPVQYSKEQMTKLRSLIDADGHKMQDNFRLPENLKNKNAVRASFQ